MVQQFIQKLLDNPNFKGQPLSLIETHISNFIQQNKQNLAPVFTKQFFPDLNSDSATDKIQNMVKQTISEQIITASRNIYPYSINFEVLVNAGILTNLNQSDFFSYLTKYTEAAMVSKEFRQKLDQVNIVLNEKMIETYVTKAFENKTYTYTELHRIDNHHFNLEILTEYMKLAAIVSASYAIKLNLSGHNESVNAFDIGKDLKQLENYIEISKSNRLKLFSCIPNTIWTTAGHITLDHYINKEVEPIAKVLRIFIYRAKDHRTNIKIDKGSETPDKSWFSIQMKNAGYLGIDKAILEDLNRLAFEMRK